MMSSTDLGAGCSREISNIDQAGQHGLIQFFMADGGLASALEWRVGQDRTLPVSLRSFGMMTIIAFYRKRWE